MNIDDLTDHQYLLVREAQHYPVILKDRGMSVTARSLEKRGWGSVEDGATGEMIFRLNQAGEDAAA